ncbi:acyl carrier protein [Streptomyces sp. UNOC14_S4]|uniref:acyl carrier protein n=1 Tax=Streptomyces sp. UNOC14_S4 TaxID=2872340 RepID=UPI001E5BB662|nr:acyl carrier protein [Streptomyces sp. UNOC14_S4]MCC3766359.1 acyl carrier protein [Streptomyces sp. UNOC14_S4]
MTSLYEPIKDSLVHHFNIPEDVVHPDSTLEDLGLDSLGVVELMCVLQDELGLRVPTDDESLKSLLTTFGQAVAAIERAQPEQPCGPQPVPGQGSPSAADTPVPSA